MTSEQFIEYLDTHAPGFKCDVCGCDNWLVTDDNEVSQIPTNRREGFPMLVAMCGHCGQAKFFFLSMIERWLKTRSEGKR